MRKTGPTPTKKLDALSKSARNARIAKRKKTDIIVVGAGPGRVGSTALATHLQREGFRVSHEAGNPCSVDHAPGQVKQDTFNVFGKGPDQRLVVARAKVDEWLDRALGERVVGDVGLANTQLMREFLLADPRVVLVAQVRDEDSYARSALTVTRGQARWETHVYHDRGILASELPRKEDRLKEHMRQVKAEGVALLREFGPKRVKVIDVTELAKKGSASWRSSKQRTNRGTTPWERTTAAVAC